VEPYVPPKRTWPTLEPIAPGSAIFTYYPNSADGPVRYGLRCEDCGTLFVRDTPEEAQEVAASRDGHGAAYCMETAKTRRKPAEPAPEASDPAPSVEAPLVTPKPRKAKPATAAGKKRGAAA
jgi:hypothetical protein